MEEVVPMLFSAAVSGLSSIYSGKKQNKIAHRMESEQAAERDRIAAAQAEEDAIVSRRETEAAAADEKQKRRRVTGGRSRVLTFLESGQSGVTGGLSTALGGGAKT